MQRTAVTGLAVLLAVGMAVVGLVALPGTDVAGAADDHDGGNGPPPHSESDDGGEGEQDANDDRSQDDHNPLDNITGSPTPTPEPTPTATPNSTDDGAPNSTDDGAPNSTDDGAPNSTDDGAPDGTTGDSFGSTPNTGATDGSLEVVDAEVMADWVQEGHEATVRVTVENTAEESTTEPLEVTVDGEQVAEPEVTVDGGETDTVDFEVTFEEGGTVAVEGVQAGEVSIGDGADEWPKPQRPGSEAGNVPEPQSGFGAGAALVALLAATLVAWQVSTRR